MKNIFDAAVTNEVIARINQLTPETKGLWGKMSVAQMLAHCSVTYEMIYDETHPKPGFFKSLIMKLFVKNIVVGPKPYKKNSPTAPAFVINDKRNFQTEKKRLIDYLQKTQELGGSYFDGKESNAFGNLTESEWNIMFYKHLDHHLSQFAV
ncbi:DUF1569 domain-containing protein [Arcticibacterium luteifluviistationis]|uniref:DUF1569 domain-containing protein n=1 Tax=Arcticibacterium luteifluviistationis TaxID=1784714 RepID=A0A2Z4G8V2_9BACT|nr:DUF1569 domain-containing protein [Arcticibacterium luteifluviistationis]AWV97586.1 hypothetical protein DJ013_05160 [Arcticibacterium luteifluviistationis]